MKTKHTILVAILIVITMAVYYPTLLNGYVEFDDNVFVENAAFQGRSVYEDLKLIFSQTVVKIYTPVTVLSFYIEKKLFPDIPFTYHFNNLLLHVLNVFLVYVFILVLGFSQRTGFFAALLFSVHPMHVESVAWLAERKDLLYSLFYLISLIYYVKYIKSKNKKYFSVTIYAGLLAILSKPMALSLPLIMLLLDWYFRRRDWKNIFLEKGIHAIYIIPITLMTYIWHARLPGSASLEALTIWLWTLGFYIKKFILPYPLLASYELPQPLFIGSGEYLLHTIIVALALIICINKRSNRLIPLSFLFMFLSIFFLLRFDAKVDLNLVADRFMYLPSLGFCLLFGYYLNVAIGKPSMLHKAGTCVLFGFLVLCSFLSYKQTKVWKSPFTLWNNVIKHQPNSGLAYEMMAADYVNRGNYATAIQYYQRSLIYWPIFAQALYKYGLVLEHIGETDKAEELYLKTLASHPGHEQAINNLSYLYMKQKRYKDAQISIEEALRNKPQNAVAWQNLGTAHYYMGQFPKAMKCFNEAIRLSPQFTSAYLNRANLKMMLQDAEGAKKDYLRVLDLDRNNRQAATHLKSMEGR